MKMLGKLARSLAARYVCQNCEKEKERRAVAHNATKCLERDVAREMLIERSTPDTRQEGAGMRLGREDGNELRTKSD